MKPPVYNSIFNHQLDIVQTGCLTVWGGGHCRFLDWRDVRTKSEVQQRCDDHKSETNEQRQLFTTSRKLKQIYRKSTDRKRPPPC